MTGVLVIIVYLIGALVSYFWWANECVKYNKGKMDADDLAEEAAEAGCLVGMLWFIFVPLVLVVWLVEWIKSKVK